MKSLSCAKINTVNLLHFINININRYLEESNRNKYLILFPIEESQDTLKNLFFMMTTNIIFQMNVNIKYKFV